MGISLASSHFWAGKHWPLRKNDKHWVLIRHPLPLPALNKVLAVASYPCRVSQPFRSNLIFRNGIVSVKRGTWNFLFKYCGFSFERIRPQPPSRSNDRHQRMLTGHDFCCPSSRLSLVACVGRERKAATTVRGVFPGADKLVWSGTNDFAIVRRAFTEPRSYQTIHLPAWLKYSCSPM